MNYMQNDFSTFFEELNRIDEEENRLDEGLNNQFKQFISKYYPGKSPEELTVDDKIHFLHILDSCEFGYATRDQISRWITSKHGSDRTEWLEAIQAKGQFEKDRNQLRIEQAQKLLEPNPEQDAIHMQFYGSEG